MEMQHPTNTSDSASPATSRPAVLFLLAHNDDEFFVLPRVELERKAGNRVVCVYTTDGGAYGIDPSRRLQESCNVLCPRGIKKEDIIPLGTELAVKDGRSFQHIHRLWEALEAATQHIPFCRMYAPSWEGGHVDHDVAHLLGVAMCQKLGGTLYEFSLYHGYRVPPPFFTCMQLIPAPGDIVRDRVSFPDSIRWLLSLKEYHSQRKTFLGLVAFCLRGILVKRELVLRNVGVRDYFSRPHDGPLFYETRFKVPHETFLEETRSFIDRILAGDFAFTQFSAETGTLLSESGDAKSPITMKP